MRLVKFNTLPLEKVTSSLSRHRLFSSHVERLYSKPLPWTSIETQVSMGSQVRHVHIAQEAGK